MTENVTPKAQRDSGIDTLAGFFVLYIAAGLIIATASNHMGLLRPLWLFNSASGLVFFLIGYLIGKSIFASIYNDFHNSMDFN